MDDDTVLYNLMRNLEDFECFPIPERWFKKFGIPPREAQNPRQFTTDNYQQKLKTMKYDLDPIIIDTPQRNGETFPVFPDEKVDVEVVSRPFVLKEGEIFPATLPYLKEQAEKERNQA